MGLKLGLSSAWEVIQKNLPTERAEKALQAFLSNPTVKQALGAGGAAPYQKALGIIQDINEAAKMALKTDAAAHIEIIIAGSVLDSGPSVIVPCQRAQAVVTVQAGANAEMLGQTLAKTDLVLGRYTKTLGSTTGACARE
jgi:hypothetical protein